MDRSEDIEQVIALLGETGGVIITGKSGAGKSTIVRCIYDCLADEGVPQSEVFDGLDDVVLDKSSKFNDFLETLQTMPQGSIIYLDSGGYLWKNRDRTGEPRPEMPEERRRCAEAMQEIYLSITERGLRFLMTAHHNYHDRSSPYYGKDRVLDAFHQFFIEPVTVEYSLEPLRK